MWISGADCRVLHHTLIWQGGYSTLGSRNRNSSRTWLRARQTAGVTCVPVVSVIALYRKWCIVWGRNMKQVEVTHNHLRGVMNVLKSRAAVMPRSHRHLSFRSVNTVRVWFYHSEFSVQRHTSHFFSNYTRNRTCVSSLYSLPSEGSSP